MQSHVGKFPELCSRASVSGPEVSVEHWPGRLAHCGEWNSDEDCICGCWKFFQGRSRLFVYAFSSFLSQHHCLPLNHRKWSREAGRCRLPAHLSRGSSITLGRGACWRSQENGSSAGRDPVTIRHVLCEATDVSEKETEPKPRAGLQGPLHLLGQTSTSEHLPPY